MSEAYYNEFNPEAAETLENLIKAGDIAPGQVDTRSIEDVRPDDLRGFTQCHFFAGIGIWSYALRRAGWPDDRPVWTGSCPCQPFSAAGKGAAFDDERHLWPAFHHLIKVRRPPSLFGEQVASSVVDDWIDLVHADLEALGYTFGSVPFPSAGVGAPHIRDRNFWAAVAVGQADSDGARLEGRKRNTERPAQRAAGSSGLVSRLVDAEGSGQSREPIRAGNERPALGNAEGSDLGWLANPGHQHDAGQKQAAGIGQPQANRSADQPGGRGVSPGSLDNSIGVLLDTRRGDNAEDDRIIAGATNQVRGLADDQLQQRPNGQRGIRDVDAAPGWQQGAAEVAGLRGDLRPGPTNGFWRDADWLGCRDGKWRPVEPGSFPLAYGLPAGMGKLSAGALRLAEVAGLDAASLKRAKSHRIIGLRGAGNAINAEAAIAWIETVMECIE